VREPAFITGADVSFLAQVEAAGGTYRDSIGVRDALEIFRDHGIDYVRLRLWHTPADGFCGLEQTVAMARRAKALGLGVLLDIHYSDTWADPGRQTKPAAWADLEFAALERAVRDYTALAVGLLRASGAVPDIVQIGNEITAGMLWEDGRVGGARDANWPRLAALLKSAAKGAESERWHGRPRILLHVDAGGDNAACRSFFDRARAEGVPFDLIGVSYYPWWHGTLDDLRGNLVDLTARYGKPVMVVETAYPWTLTWSDATHNLVGEPGRLLPGFPASEEGQRAFLAAELSLLREVAKGGEGGVFYWAPDWISTRGFGSAWENVALFDFEGNALPSLDAFNDVPRAPREPR
jgi:arabinogalactan endo-1,4-beta-galactosidase